jgi:ribosomal protein S18 acetylase RimI-like enzyme
MEVVVDKMGSSDLEEIFSLAKDEEYFEGFWSMDQLKDAVEDENVISIVLKVDGELAGFLLAHYSPSFRKVSWENLYITPEFRGKKVNGKKLTSYLIEDLERISRELGAESIQGLVSPENVASFGMVKRCGYESLGLHEWIFKML